MRGGELPAFVDGLCNDNYPGSDEQDGRDCLLIVFAIVDLLECVDERISLVLNIQLWCGDSHWSYANWVNRLINSLWHRCVGALKKPHPVKGRADGSGVLLGDGLEGEDLLGNELVAFLAGSDLALLIGFARLGVRLGSE